MNVDLYERIWMWSAGVIVVVFLGTIFVMAGAQAVHPPSHLETVDPTALADHPEFGNPAVTTRPDGTVVVPVVASMFAFAPDPIEVPANRPVVFRLTSGDVVHAGNVEVPGRIPGGDVERLVEHQPLGRVVVRVDHDRGVV